MKLSSNQLRLLGRLLFLLVPYTLLRAGFYFYHFNTYRQFTSGEIFESFLMGIRFDIAAICLINFPIIILSIFPRVNEKFERLCFILLNAIGFIASVDDYELFHFVGKRLGLDFFVITEDILEQLPQLILYYWYLPLAAVLFTVGYYFFDKKFFTSKNVFLHRWPVHLASSVLILGMTFVGIRGGLQHKSINVQTAFVQGKNELGHLVLNTPYHFFRTLKNQRIKKLTYFNGEEFDLIQKHRKLEENYKGEPKANIVLIILESFASEYVEKGYAPFLSELSTKSLTFERHLANGRRSIESLPSILCGLPALIDEPISKSVFGGNKFTCLPQILKQHGYTNHFFHAGSRGTMGFESYTLANGFDRYFSRENYPTKDDFDGTWGIFDGPYLKYFGQELDKTKQPFLAGVFTLSSHQPYKIPDQFQGKFPKGTLEIHESIGYTDAALKGFFEAVKNKPWFSNTLFVITADHSQKLETTKYQNLIGYYRVPLILYAPGHSWKMKAPKKVTQHSDIPRTILDYLDVKSDGMAATSQSAFAQDEGLALNYAEGSTYFMVRGDLLFEMDKAGGQTVQSFNWDTGASGPVEKTDDPLLKAYLQYFVNGLITNNLSLYR